MKFEVGQTITTFSPNGYTEGAMVEIFSPCGRKHKTARVVMVHPAGGLTVRVATRWDVFCYVLMRPRFWKRALDIPFTPPDILVRS